MPIRGKRRKAAERVCLPSPLGVIREDEETETVGPLRTIYRRGNGRAVCGVVPGCVESRKTSYLPDGDVFTDPVRKSF